MSTPTTPRLQADVKALVGSRLAALDELRTRLPLDDPDRHALDVDADRRFAQLACDHPDRCACEPWKDTRS